MRVPWYLMAKGKGGGGYKTASGPIVSVNDALAAPLRSLLVNIDPVQEGTGDPSPENVRPISGWSAVNVWVKPTYDPTANPTATIQLGQTVYGGTLDVTNGVLTVTHNMVNFDNYTGTISKSASAYIPSGRAFYWIKLSGSPNPGGDGNPNHIFMKSSIYDIQDKSYLNMFQLSEFAMSIGRDTSVCMVGFNVDDSLSTVDLFRAWLQSASCDVWYPLATPITIPLTPTEISTLQGQNNVWADSGDVTVEYLSSGGANPDLMKLAVAFMGRK